MPSNQSQRALSQTTIEEMLTRVNRNERSLHVSNDRLTIERMEMQGLAELRVCLHHGFSFRERNPRRGMATMNTAVDRQRVQYSPSFETQKHAYRRRRSILLDIFLELQLTYHIHRDNGSLIFAHRLVFFFMYTRVDIHGHIHIHINVDEPPEQDSVDGPKSRPCMSLPSACSLLLLHIGSCINVNLC